MEHIKGFEDKEGGKCVHCNDRLEYYLQPNPLCVR